jgi:ABC-2 type transport system ATP-binding protein
VLVVTELRTALPALLAQAERTGAGIDRLATHRATLEDVFVHLTGRHLRE